MTSFSDHLSSVAMPSRKLTSVSKTPLKRYRKGKSRRRSQPKKSLRKVSWTVPPRVRAKKTGKSLKTSFLTQGQAPPSVWTGGNTTSIMKGGGQGVRNRTESFVESESPPASASSPPPTDYSTSEINNPRPTLDSDLLRGGDDSSVSRTKTPELNMEVCQFIVEEVGRKPEEGSLLAKAICRLEKVMYQNNRELLQKGILPLAVKFRSNRELLQKDILPSLLDLDSTIPTKPRPLSPPAPKPKQLLQA